MPDTLYYSLYLKKFNNYFNRIIKTLATLSDYEDAAEEYFYYSKSINYNPNDSVSTELIMNDCPFDADYVIIYDNSGTIISRWFVMETIFTRTKQKLYKLRRDLISDYREQLVTSPMFVQKAFLDDSDSFIVNDEGMSFNQVKKAETLLKDKTGSAWIVGYMAKNAPAATITEQIPDETQVYFETIENLATELNIDSSVLDAALTENTENPSFFVNDNIEIVGWLNYAEGTPLEIKIVAGSADFLGSFTYSSSATVSHSNVNDCFAKDILLYNPGIHENWKTACETYKAQIKAAWQSMTGTPLLSKVVFNRLKEMSLSGTLVYKQGKYYRIKIGAVEGPTNTKENKYSSAISSPFSSVCSNYINSFSLPERIEDLNRGRIFINYNEIKAFFYLEAVTNTSDIPGITVTMSSTRNVIQNQPYDIFAIPYNNITAEDNVDTYDVNGEYAQKIAMALVKSLTSSNVYDVQLLPYCPIPQIAAENGINVSSLTSGKDYDWIDYTGQMEVVDTADVAAVVNEYAPQQYEATATYQSTIDDTDLVDWGWDAYTDTTDPNALDAFEDWKFYAQKRKTVVGGKSKFEVYGQVQDPQNFEYADVTVTFWFKYKTTGTVHRSIIIYPKSNSFSVNLDYNLSLVENMKIDSQVAKHRLVSPNYQGTFEFNVAKNGGAVNGFIAECSYKPYVPYIKVAPNFGFLYGTNYGDNRGLICGGDFSIGIINSAWEQYQLNNKNYQNIFNREIQNLTVEQTLQMRQQIITGSLGIAAAGITGGVLGAQAGGVYGAIAGAAVGTAGSSVGFGLDIDMLALKQREEKSLAIDKYNYQLGNIKALPYTLTKVGAFDINSKIWPFIETYLATDEEIEALENKIRYESMTVMRIDIIGRYMGAFEEAHYLKGELIRNEEIAEDNHVFEALYAEFAKGVYC